MTAPFSTTYYFGDSLTDTNVIAAALGAALFAQGLAAEIDTRLATSPDPITAQDIFNGLLPGLGPNPSELAVATAQLQAFALVENGLDQSAAQIDVANTLALIAQTAQQQAAVELAALGFGPEGAVSNEFTHAVYAGDIGDFAVENFANAGARALGTQEPFGEGTGYDSNLQAQLDRFQQATVDGVAPNAAAVLLIGSNDFSDILDAAINAPGSNFFTLIDAVSAGIEDLLSALETAARTLSDSGVDAIFFGTLPAATFFPGADTLDALSAGVSDFAIGLYNALLGNLASTLGADGIHVSIIDYAALANAVSEDPTGFGILAERSDFLVDGSVFDSDQVGFWDPIHPAEAVHQAWGAYSAFVMEGGSTASLSDLGTLSIQTSGNNAVFANGGDDTVFLLAGDDVGFGGSGDDNVVGGRGNDIVSGGSGNDTLFGSRGIDIIDGGHGNDLLRGGAGNDVLIDGLGNDTVLGGSGDDAFIFVEGSLDGDSSPTQDVFRGGSGFDTLYLVLSDARIQDIADFGIDSVLVALGITDIGIEAYVAIDGRDQVESVLGGNDWFQDADYWGLIAAPTGELLV